MLRILTAVALSFAVSVGSAHAAEYQLDIARKSVNVTGTPVEKITINGSIPGPTLHFREGEDVTIRVTNHLDEPTSVHWHGLLLPGMMDGVPGTNGFHGIAPGATFVYHFPIRQTGTYWYHAHSAGQEQDGLYGSLVIHPKGADPIKADRDYVVLLSDFKNENAEDIMANVKMDSGYYNYNKRTVGDFFRDAETKGFDKAWKSAKEWGAMRMSPTDLADVTGYTFLVNGLTQQQNWTGLFKHGERVRLRFINASAMTIYDVRIPGLKMTVVAADGQPIEPVAVNEFRFGVAETYDVIVEPKDDRAYTIAAESIDRTGFAFPPIAAHAPYLDYVAQVDLFFAAAVSTGHISAERASNKIDSAYLYYLPFTQIFISGDNLHARMTPLFLQGKQKFVWGPDLKADLKRLVDVFKAHPDIERLGLAKVASMPPNDDAGPIAQLYDTYLPRWRTRQIEVPPEAINDNPKLHAEIMRQMKAMEAAARKPMAQPVRLADYDRENLDMLTMERRVAKRRGDWQFLPADLEDE